MHTLQYLSLQFYANWTQTYKAYLQYITQGTRPEHKGSAVGETCVLQTSAHVVLTPCPRQTKLNKKTKRKPRLIMATSWYAFQFYATSETPTTTTTTTIKQRINQYKCNPKKIEQWAQVKCTIQSSIPRNTSQYTISSLETSSKKQTRPRTRMYPVFW